MKEKFKGLPAALQKQIILRLAACALSLLLFVVMLAVYRDLYQCLPFVVFCLFFGAFGALLLFRAADGKFVVVDGQCNKVERTAIRKRPKTIYFVSEPHSVKLPVRHRIKNIEAGDSVTVYVSENAPVYQEEGCQILSGYLAIEIRKGRDGNDRG